MPPGWGRTRLGNLLGDLTSLYIEEAGFACTLRELPVASIEIRKDPEQTGISLWDFLPCPAASSMTTVQGSPVPFFQAAHATQRWPLCPAAEGGKVFAPRPWWASKVSLAGFFSFVCSTEHSPLPGLLQALLPAVLALPRHYWCPGSLWLFCPLQAWSKSELCSSHHSIFQGVLASDENSLGSLPSLLGRVSGLLLNPEAWMPNGLLPLSALPEDNTSVGQALEHISLILGQEAQWSIFWKAKSVLVFDVCPTLVISHSTTHLFALVFCTWSVPILILLIPQSSENRDCLTCIPAVALCATVAFLC